MQLRDETVATAWGRGLRRPFQTRLVSSPWEAAATGRLTAPVDLRSSASGSVAFLSMAPELDGPAISADVRLPLLSSGVTATLRDLRPGELVSVRGASLSSRGDGGTLLSADSVDSARLLVAAADPTRSIVPLGNGSDVRRRESAYGDALLWRDLRVEAAEAEMLRSFRKDRAFGDSPGAAFVHAIEEFGRSHPSFSRDLLARSARLLANDLPAGDGRMFDAVGPEAMAVVLYRAPSGAGLDWPEAAPVRRAVAMDLS